MCNDLDESGSNNCIGDAYSVHSLCVQVGDYRTDHPINIGEPYVAEAVSDNPGTRNATRPVFILNTQTNGSDMLGEAVAAYASLSMLFIKIDPTLSVLLEGDAFAIYDLMLKMPNTRYSDADPVSYRVCNFSWPLPLNVQD